MKLKHGSVNITPRKKVDFGVPKKLDPILKQCTKPKKKPKFSLLNNRLEGLINKGIEMADKVKKITFEYKQNNYAKRLSELVGKQKIRIGYSNVDDVLEEVHNEQSKRGSQANLEQYANGGNVFHYLAQRSLSFLSATLSHDDKEEETEYIQLDNLIKKLTMKHSIKNDLLYAIKMSNHSKAKRILESNPLLVNENLSMNQNSLQVAAKVGDADMVKLLIDKGTNIYYKDLIGRTAYDIAKSYGNLGICSLLSK